MRCPCALNNPSITASSAAYLCTKEAKICRSFSGWLVKKSSYPISSFDKKQTQSLPLEVAKRHEGLRKQLSIVFPRVWPSRSETGVNPRERSEWCGWRMRWKKIEILLFSIHNAFGYTSPPASQEPLLKEKPFECSANICGSSVERRMFFKTFPDWKFLALPFFKKVAKNS